MSDWDAKTAEWYAENYGDYPTNTLAVDALDLAPNSTIVDIGCGTGSALRHAAKQVTAGQLVGIDPVPRMVEIAREQTTNHAAAARIRYYEGPAENLPVDDNFANVVFAFDSFDHWQDQLQGLREVSRILKAGGQFVVVKDSGLPAGSKARQEFINLLIMAEFQVLKEQKIEDGDVAFTMWVCTHENTKPLGE